MISVWLIHYNHCKLIKLTFCVRFTKNGIVKLTKYGLSPKGFYFLRSVTHIMVKKYNCSSTGTCIFGDAATFINKESDCRVLFEDIFTVPFLGFALDISQQCAARGWEIWLHLTAMICPPALH